MGTALYGAGPPGSATSGFTSAAITGNRATSTFFSRVKTRDETDFPPLWSITTSGSGAITINAYRFKLSATWRFSPELSNVTRQE
jgi:hypothetical protein